MNTHTHPQNIISDIHTFTFVRNTLYIRKAEQNRNILTNVWKKWILQLNMRVCVFIYINTDYMLNV